MVTILGNFNGILISHDDEHEVNKLLVKSGITKIKMFKGQNEFNEIAYTLGNEETESIVYASINDNEILEYVKNHLIDGEFKVN
jgi:hypothetical protein